MFPGCDSGSRTDPRRQASVDRQVGALASAPKVTATEALGTNYAGFWARALGNVIDSAIGMALFFAVATVFAAFDTANWPVPDPLGDDGGEMSDAAAALLLGVSFVAYRLYVTLTMSSRRMATAGMRAVGIVVTDTQEGGCPSCAPLGDFSRPSCPYTQWV